MNNPLNPSIELRNMREADFPDCQRLREQTGWNQTLSDWRRFLSYDARGCFVATQGGRVVGTACTISYEDRFGWVAMVIVDRECRRMGIGARLLKAGIEHLEDRGLAVKLDATPEGKMLYDTLGFQDEYGVARLEGGEISVSDEYDEQCGFLSQEDLEKIDAYDAPIFGASRRPVLESYLHYYPESCFWVRGKDGAAGYIMAREGTNAFHVGPWAADDPETAKRLLAALLQTRRPQRVFVDILEPNPYVRPMLENMGFHQQRPFIRMYKGKNDYPGKPELIYALSGPELG
ncbi:MAG: GNAT family N-acetyltransferase [Candidatus Omnitrophica bacterium]|nr:GNAT family N-acetyltransferase [Candidatus Omnitrophota bacterium]